MSNKKIFFFVMLSIFLIYGVTQISAADNLEKTNVNLSDTIHDTSLKDNINSQLSQDDNNNVDSTNNRLKVNVTSKDIQKQEKNIKTSKRIVITNKTFDTYFTNKYLNDKVSAGDVLDLRGYFYGDRYSMYINKAVNITSSTKDAYINLNTSANDWFGGDDVAAFTITREGAYTNVSDIYFFNSQIFVKNSHHIIFNNISAIVDSSTVGRGVGQTSIRDNSSFVTVENSTFSTKDQWGGCGLVLAWANNCTIRYNTLYGIGEAGNLFYLTTFNVDNLPYNETGLDYNIINVNNTFENNVLIGPDHPQAMCYVICLSGTNNRIVNNTVLNYTGYGINVQAYSFDYDMKTLIANNTLVGSNFFMPNGSTIINNTVTGNVTIGTRNIMENNTFNTIKIGYDNMALTNTKADNIFINNMNNNITIANCTIAGNITVKGSSTSMLPRNIVIKNNSIGENIFLNGSNNVTINGNDIAQQIIMTTRNNANVTIENNTIINDKEYTIIADKRVKGLNISDNYLLTDAFIGNDTLYLNPLYDDYILKNDMKLFKINDTNYQRFFNEDATLRSDIPNEDITLEVDGDIYNKKFLFTNGTINITNPKGHTLYNTSIEVTSSARVMINEVKIINNNNHAPVSINSTVNTRIINSYIKSDDGVIINNSRNVLVDNNYINTTCDYSVQIINSVNVNVTNNALYAKNQEGDASVKVINSTASIHDNNVLNNKIVITGNLTVYKPSSIELRVTDLKANPIKYGDMNVYVNNKNYNVTYIDGRATLNYTPQNMNNVNITATYISPNKLEITRNASLKVNPIDTKTTIISVTALVNQQVTVNATIRDALNNNVRDGLVSFTDDTGKLLGVADVTNGVATVKVSYTKNGIYNITASYSNSSTYKSSSAKATVTVNQVNLAISGNLTVLTPSTININVTNQNNAIVTTGSVEVYVNSQKQGVTFKNGVATCSYTPKNTNKLNVSVVYTTADKFSVTNNATLSVAVINTKISLPSSLLVLLNQQVTVNATIKDAMDNNVKDGIVSFTDGNGKSLGNVKVVNGIASINVSYSKVGDYKVNAAYSNSSIYNLSKANANIKVNQINIAVKGSLTVLTSSTITVNITNQNNNFITTGTVDVYVNNQKQSVTFKNGVATCSYTPQNTNKLNVSVVYTTADKFSVTKNATLSVSMISTKTSLTSLSALVNQPVTVNATVKDALNNNVKDGIVSFNDSTGKSWGDVKVINGLASVKVNYTKIGTYTITASYSNSSNYRSSTTKATITINQINIAVSSNLIAFTSGNITVNVTNQDNLPITTGSIEVYINNQKQKVNFNKGVATLSYTPQNTNKLNISAVYTTQDKFNVTKNTTLNVNKITTKLTITTNNKAPRVNEKVKLTFTLKDNNNNIVANQKITANINNIDYSLITNKTGMATLHYVLNKNHKNITARVKYDGNTSYYASNTNMTLNRTYKVDMELLTGSFDTKPGDTVKLIAHIKDNGVDINGGQLVFKLNGLSLKDEKGNAVIVQIVNGLAVLEYKISDTLGARTHNLTAVYASTTYGRVELTTPMTINKYTTHIDINPIVATTDKITIKAQVVDQNNQALNKQTTIALKINGKSYTLTTINGTINYQLTQSLKDGYYNITLISGENGKYLGATSKTVLIKTNNTINTNYINNTLNTKTSTKSGDTKTSKILSILTGSSMVKPGDRLKLIAHLSEDEVDITGGQLVFKLNGLSLKDEKGNAVVVNIKNGLGILDYKIPDTLGARTHNLTAVYASSKYGRVELTTELTMNRLNTHIDAEPLFTKSSTGYVKAEILDDNNQLINRQTDIVIKIDGKSYSMNCSNGKINFKIPTTLNNGVHQVTIIVGENGKYLSSRLNTVVIRN